MLRNVVIEKLRAGRAPRVADLKGFESAPIYDVTIRDSDFTNVAQPSNVLNVRNLRLERVRVNGRPVTSLA